jgi:hypothetical protein
LFKTFRNDCRILVITKTISECTSLLCSLFSEVIMLRNLLYILLISTLFPTTSMTYAVFLHMQPPENWNGGVGFVSKEMIQSHCPAPAEDIQVNLECFFSVHYED